MKANLLIVVVVVAMTACTDLGTDLSGASVPIPENSSAAEAKLLLVGKWEWVKSVGSSFNPNQVFTPESEGYTRQLWFSQDGRVAVYRNNVRLKTISYEVVPYGGLGGSFLCLIMGDCANTRSALTAASWASTADQSTAGQSCT